MIAEETALLMKELHERTVEAEKHERIRFYALRGWGKCCRLIRRLCEHQLPSETVQRLKREFEDEKKKETRP